MKEFMNDNFLLSTDIAQHLYHEYAKNLPIFDYHCHLNPKDIAEDRQFRDLTEIWLDGDHYKWRVSRTAGIPEYFITGEASNYDKYKKWSEVVPLCIGNPIYHWVHLELARPFGIKDKLFNLESADEIWQHCNLLLSKPNFSARGIMKQMGVCMVGTTDDPLDSLEYHKQIYDDKNFDIDVTPTFRPDRIFKIEQEGFCDYIKSLEKIVGYQIQQFSELKEAILSRLLHFDQHGCKSADHGIEILRFATIPNDNVLDSILQRRLQGYSLSEIEISQFSTAILVWLGKQYHKMSWVMQYHIGAIRNNNTRMFRILGADSGFDSIGDRTYAEQLSSLLDKMDQTDELPKTILYCLNPRDNEMIASMIGNFQGGIAGKIQFGSGWWFNDQKDGMKRQLKQLSHLSLLSQFIGMLTDSRSFLSYTRHEYFRRILCEILGNWIENGEVPNDIDLIGNIVSNICFYNAKNYFK